VKKTDYISGTEDAHKIENIRVQVSLWSETEKSYCCIVDLRFNEKGEYTGGSRTEWFPKSLCSLEKIDNGRIPDYFLTAPEWLLIEKKVKYDKK
jgi:hypothetical protein